MSDKPAPDIEEQVEALEVRESEQRRKAVYSDEDKFVALAAVDLNGGNVYRTAVAIGIPASTLKGWVESRRLRQEQFAELRKEKRGDLAAKVEALAHSALEAAADPAKVAKATFLQLTTGSAILLDKLRILRGQGLDPDPAAELCRLLNINRSQLPDRLELQPGEEIPPEFAGPIIETQPHPSIPNSFEPESINLEPIPEAHHPDCLINPNLPDSCSCGADDRNQAKLKAQDDEPVN